MKTGVAQPPRATLRLQFHAGFTLDDAVPLTAYFAELGISHLYASPLLSARSGSTHGYDVVDPTRINPELGGEAALRRLVQALRKHDMGLILDIVSNHMAVGGADNPWWQDLLQWGRQSPYAGFFDIQWHPCDPLLEEQLLVPFLHSDYGVALRDGTLPLRFDSAAGAFYVEHANHRFPICARDFPRLLEATGVLPLQTLAKAFQDLGDHADAPLRAVDLEAQLARLARKPVMQQAIDHALILYDSRQPDGFQRLHRLLEDQHYRLASWRTAADDINWRRFFDINELAGLRVERRAVFDATHGKILQLIGDGLVDGLRVDHIDGLADPRGYCRKLRRRVDEVSPHRHVPIYVEKILGRGESLPDDWLVDGSTGYEFMNQLALLQHDPQGAAPLAQLWSQYSQRPPDFTEETRLARQQILSGSLAGDFERVARSLLNVARQDLMSRDLTLGSIRRALQALIVHFPVYRTYIKASGRSAQDEVFFLQARSAARSSLAESDWPVLDYLERWLGGEPWRNVPQARQRQLLKEACVRFQQLTSPTAAKAVEDTALYRYGILLSRNDVGFNTEQFSASVADFHQACQQRQARFPHNLLASATHDHKRGEDSRARLAVLSERADWYHSQIAHWCALAQPLRSDPLSPSPGDELLLYQSLLGSWPLDLADASLEQRESYYRRVAQWQRKALREAKLHSDWNAPNQNFEQACEDFLKRLLLAPVGQTLRDSIAEAVDTIAVAGALNGLAQSLLKLSVPGVPDIYQGTEFWDFSLVDPDNRQAVDFSARRHALKTPLAPACLLSQWRNGRIKQALIIQTLALRCRYPALFAQGRYRPLEVVGLHAQRVVAFTREHRRQRAIVIVPRLASELLAQCREPQIPAALWGDTRVLLPFADSRRSLKGLFSTCAVTHHKALMVSDALRHFPVNLFIQI